MKALLAALILVSTPAWAQSDPRIRQCGQVERQYGTTMVKFRQWLDAHTMDTGGRIDPTAVVDINFALVDAKEFVNTNIAYVQRAHLRGEQPSVERCTWIANMARNEIGKYARYVANNIDLRDRTSRRLAAEELRLAFQEYTREVQGY